MDKRDLKRLTKKQLIKLLLKQQAQKPRNSVKEHEDIIQPPEQFRDTYKPIPPPRTGKWESVKPKPVPCKSVKQMVNEYEDIILPPPKQFRDRPPKPTRKPPPVPKVEEHITNVPVPKIKELNKALNPISTGLFCLVVALGGGGGVFHPPSITPLSLKLDCSNFVQSYFQIG